MFKKNPQLIKNKGNKCPLIKFLLGYSFAIREGLLRINNVGLLRITAGYENGYRFHSYDSQVFPTIRTQYTTIPNYASPSRLYIYIKWKCVEMLTVSRMHVDSQKTSSYIGYINQTHAY